MTVTLVAGASGIVGSHVVRRLLDSGATVRAFVRGPAKAAAVLGSNVERRRLRRARHRRGRVERCGPRLPRQPQRPSPGRYETNVIDAAARAGVDRVVKLSASGAHVGSPLQFWDWQGRIEARLDASAVPAVVLRPNFYMANLLASTDAIRYTGQLILPAAPASPEREPLTAQGIGPGDAR